jgi:hypothetical protein
VEESPRAVNVAQIERTDMRVFHEKIGAFIGTTTIYTVPNGYYFFVIGLYRTLQDGSGSCTIQFIAPSGALMFGADSDGTALGYQEGRNLCPDGLRLLPGDVIQALDDLSGGQYIHWFVDGYLETIR